MQVLEPFAKVSVIIHEPPEARMSIWTGGNSQE
jgi:hypothetical protein